MYFQQIHEGDPRLLTFVSECRARGIDNNSSLSRLGFHTHPHTAFFAGIDDERIKVFSGVHSLHLHGTLCWRVGYRGISLYDSDTTPTMSHNLRAASPNVGVLFTLQMRWVERHFGPSRFVMTATDAGLKSNTTGKQYTVDKLLKRRGLTGFELLSDSANIAGVTQNVWMIDKSVWYADFAKYYPDADVR